MSRRTTWFEYTVIAAAFALFVATGLAVYWSAERTAQLAISAFGGLVGTAFGVLLGLLIDRRAQEARRASENAERRAQEDLQLALAELALREELTQNGTAVLQLTEALSFSKTSRADVWDLAFQIADSIQASAYSDFRSLPQARLNVGLFENVSLSYRTLVRLKNQMQQGRAFHALSAGLLGNQQKADERLRDVLIATRIAHAQIVHALSSLRIQLTLTLPDDIQTQS